jgi:hypothetical protein
LLAGRYCPYLTRSVRDELLDADRNIGTAVFAQYEGSFQAGFDEMTKTLEIEG